MTVTEQLAELPKLAVSELAARYEKLFGKPPRVRNKAFLVRQIAWKLQEREFGGLSAQAKARLDELMAAVELPLHDGTPPAPRAPARVEPAAPLIGTTLVRAWRGQQLRVEVRERGFEWNGVVYPSLSACARAITGANWNGRLFFGLVDRRKRA